MTDFLIKKDLVISSMISNNRSVDKKEIIELIDVEESTNAERLAEIEKPVPVEAEKPIVICYKY